MTHRPKVVVALDLAPDLMDEIAAYDVVALPEAATTPGALAREVADAQGLLVSSNVSVDRALIMSARRLKVVSTMSAGLDHLDLEAAHEAGVVVTNAPVLSDAVADLTMALVIMVKRRLPEALRNVAEGRWDEPLLGHDLAGQRLLIVGFGRIGRAVATRAMAAGMRVASYDVRADVPSLDGVEQLTDFPRGLADADVVSLHVDLNDSTRGLIGERELSAMKATAVLVNTSRGAVVDQAAITRALAGGGIAGAGLDVLADEPPLAGEPLLSMPNVVVLPHLGSATVETRRAMARCSVVNLMAVLEGEDPPYRVTPR